MMNRKMNINVIKIFVIEDGLQKFSNHENILTISELDELIRCKLIRNFIDQYEIYIDNGICKKKIKSMYDYINDTDLSRIFHIHIPKSLKKRKIT